MNGGSGGAAEALAIKGRQCSTASSLPPKSIYTIQEMEEELMFKKFCLPFISKIDMKFCSLKSRIKKILVKENIKKRTKLEYNFQRIVQ